MTNIFIHILIIKLNRSTFHKLNGLLFFLLKNNINKNKTKNQKLNLTV